MDKQAVIERLNRILELELAGVVRYTHYALMVYGVNRIPIVKWLEKQAEEALQHAREVGELITYLGGHPSLAIGPLLETYRHEIEEILKESLEHELKAFEEYKALLELVKDKDPRLEEWTREKLKEELEHYDEVNKMLRKPGQIEVYH
ncbi:ferritin-like domain-containing protein [Pampinifervens florentissimum]|uniref:ferritin-like domain-containing protein n=1 Tax=Pampinifervens florentissimum TaxID=1632019 RepID=UPI0013B4831E|nr:ferritin-like domain-containing protein [Hydrogenobacter sp. T-8]QID33869.1 bacterioferritin [Hydrogenobacter sp. T-8]